VPHRQRLPGRSQLAARTGHSRAVMQALAEQRDVFVPADRVHPLDWLNDRSHPAQGLGTAHELRAILAVDGSRAAVEARAGFPSARYGFVQASAVLLDLEAYEGQRAAQFVNPVVLRDARRNALVSLDLPTSGAYLGEGMNIRDSWRRAIFDLFSSRGVSVDGETTSLLDQLFSLQGRPDKPATSVEVPRCPNGTCASGPIEVQRVGTACATCAGDIYPTDALRITESVTDQGPNEEALGRLMQVVELLVLTAFLGILYRQARSALRDTAFIADGPLAVFGEAAKLKSRALRYVQAMTLSAGGPFVMGLEKSGQFVDFAEALARHAAIAPRTLIEIDDEVLGRIRNDPDTSDYGQETYWGRKFIYYSADRSVLVLSVPPPSGEAYGRGVGQSAPASYPALPSLLRVIDRTGSSMYRNAIVPSILAHDVAAYPIGVGTEILTLVARQILRLGD
jgi:hypothetical protein